MWVPPSKLQVLLLCVTKQYVFIVLRLTGSLACWVVGTGGGTSRWFTPTWAAPRLCECPLWRQLAGLSQSEDFTAEQSRSGDVIHGLDAEGTSSLCYVLLTAGKELSGTHT